LVPLALCAAALICLAIIFKGCRPTLLPQDLFFLKGLWGYYSSKEGVALLLLKASKAMLSRLLKPSRLVITVYISIMAATTLTVIMELFINIFK
ncbi:hypothetical protein IFM46972_11544, partial [Aspergillus udagawae]